MKTYIFNALLGGMLALSSSTAMATGSTFDDMVKKAGEYLNEYTDDGKAESDTYTGGDKQEETEISVAEALKKIKFAAGSAKSGVDYYLYLYSSACCCACEALMPKVAEIYKKEISKEPRVELILISGGKDADAVKAYVKKHKGDFPALWSGNCSKQPLKDLPGYYPPHFVPTLTIVDKMGNVILNVPGDLTLEWKKYTIEAKDGEK